MGTTAVRPYFSVSDLPLTSISMNSHSTIQTNSEIPISTKTTVAHITDVQQRVIVKAACYLVKLGQGKHQRNAVRTLRTKRWNLIVLDLEDVILQKHLPKLLQLSPTSSQFVSLAYQQNDNVAVRELFPIFFAVFPDRIHYHHGVH